ncbi:Z1 domain-containing protein [Mycoplasmatota bacterium zrk1]
MNNNRKILGLKAIASQDINDLYENGIVSREMIINLVKQINVEYSLCISEEDVDQVIREFLESHAVEMEPADLISLKHEKWFDSVKGDYDLEYWQRYKDYLKNVKGFPISSINELEITMDKLTDLIRNPHGSTIEFSNKGLVIGDVQSGKTMNYAGLICRAADIGYKVIIVLAGTIEKLRSQTQQRLDSDFVGFNTGVSFDQNKKEIIGVGKTPINNESTKYITPLTNIFSDFKKDYMRGNLTTISGYNGVVFAVMKKNVSSLKNLNSWLESRNFIGENNLINDSILIIDDEADYASLNTKDMETDDGQEKDPTAINMQIRRLIKLFSKSTYVGFTATPYANVFVNPLEEHNILADDLFPRDFILCLNAPSNYIGARNIHVNRKSKDKIKNYNYMVEEIVDLEEEGEFFPIKHNKNQKYDFVHSSMKKAIYQYLIGNVIRDIRGDNKSHRTMMINISRFVDVQKSIYKTISEYVEEIKNDFRLFSKVPNDSKHILEAKKVFYESYNITKVEWNKVKRNLYKSNAAVKILVVNSDKNYEQLEYEKYPNGLRVIAIGGISLSRGLTLEGLAVSYLYRSSRAYDTILQMCRWFGYRANYDDLCRIWITPDMNASLSEISLASDELRNEVRIMDKLDKKPYEFALKVRSSNFGLMITARNKMRTGQTCVVPVSISGDIIETPKLHVDNKILKNNFKITQDFVNKLSKYYDNDIKDYKNIPVREIADFLYNFDVHKSNFNYNANSLINFIMSSDDLNQWDISIASGRSKKTFTFDGIEYKFGDRTITPRQGSDYKQVSGSNNRLGGPSDGIRGLSDDEVKLINDYFINKKGSVPKSQKEFFMCFEDIKFKRNPLLVIYPFYDNTIEAVGISLGFPASEKYDTNILEYVINKNVFQQYFEFDE